MPPQTLTQRVSRLVSDAATKPDTNIYERWDTIAETVGAECAAELGPIPKADLFDVDLDTAIQYSAADADATRRIFPILDAKIDEMGLRRALEIDLAVVPIIAEMQQNGMLVDREYLGILNEIFTDTLADLEYRCYQAAGRRFLITSPDQVGDVLFTDLQLPGGRRCKKKDRYSTDEKTLDMLAGAHPIIALLKEHREVSKLKSTYTEVLPTVLSPDGRVRMELGMTTIPSGRLNCWGGINLLGIPVRTELGREIRRAFKAPEGRKLGAVDLNQIELRGLAVLSGDENLLQAYSDGADLHALTAAEALFHVPLRSVTYEQRQRGKTTNFAVANQISYLGLRDQFFLSGISITDVEAQQYLDGWYKRYDAVQPWYESIYTEGRQRGFVRCPLSGRILYSPGLRTGVSGTKGEMIRGQAERVATNFLLQTYASTIGKVGMAEVWHYLDTDHICDPVLWVHDEFLEEHDEDRSAEVAVILPALITETELAHKQPIPIVAAFHEGDTWRDLK